MSIGVMHRRSAYQSNGYAMGLLIAMTDQMSWIAFAVAINFNAAHALMVAAVLRVNIIHILSYTIVFQGKSC